MRLALQVGNYHQTGQIGYHKTIHGLVLCGIFLDQFVSLFRSSYKQLNFFLSNQNTGITE